MRKKMKRTIELNLAARIRFLKRCGWSIVRLSERFKMSKEFIKKVCMYKVEEIKGERLKKNDNKKDREGKG